ncbi:MAG: phosphoglucosamine mutase [Leptolyngbyaceae bacterium]|nr:phosphoglucosamine mutase [Leptolyngbyaceae bacterium]
MVLSSVPGHQAPSFAAVSPEHILKAASIRHSSMLWDRLDLPSGKLFGTDGIRGRASDILTPALAAQVGYSAGQVLRESTGAAHPIVVGQDSRTSSDYLAIALAAGLTAAGLDVWHLGLCPTPAVAHLTATSEAMGGVMISASHNPPEDNGIKFFGAQGHKLSKTVQAEIEQSLRSHSAHSFHSVAPSPQWDRYTLCSERLTEYLHALHRPLISKIDLQGLKVVLDLAWGAAVNLAPMAFVELGADVICLHDQPDGDRINVNCGSTHLESLKAAVHNHNADMGFAFDGDADRVMAVDGKGRVVDGDYILYLWGSALKQAGQLPDDTIVATVMSNLGFERAWNRQGGILVRTAVGDQYVHAEMVSRNAALGGEQSGHILCPHYSVSGDGTLTALHMASLVQESGCSLADLIDDSFQTYPQILKNVRVEDADRRLNWAESDELQGAIAQAEAAMGDQGRVLIRASGTEPVIRVMVEAATDALVTHWTDYLVSAVQQYAQ